jgi:F-type H+-transporting ATPase subunit a
MPAIELFGVFTKPFALMIRLFANIMAGHSVILALTSVIFVTASMGAAVSASMTAVSVLFCIFMNCVEVLVAFIQAYVFTMLSAVFIGLSRVKEHEA